MERVVEGIAVNVETSSWCGVQTHKTSSFVYNKVSEKSVYSF